MKMRVESTHHASTWYSPSAITRRKERDRVRRGGKNALQHNNGMHPTGQSADAIRQIECCFECFPAGDAGRSVASH